VSPSFGRFKVILRARVGSELARHVTLFTCTLQRHVRVCAEREQLLFIRRTDIGSATDGRLWGQQALRGPFVVKLVGLLSVSMRYPSRLKIPQFVPQHGGLSRDGLRFFGCVNLYNAAFKSCAETIWNVVGRRGMVKMWVLTGSNRRHSPCKGDALPAELSTQR